MTPSDHRLDHVSARLIERLEGSRRSWHAPDVVAAESARVAEEHLTGAVAELRQLTPGPEGERQAAFLRTEIERTVLPRYVELAGRYNDLERRSYGFGKLGEPLGRAAVAILALLFTWLVLLRFLWEPVVWPLIPLLFSVPLWPDLAAWTYRRRLVRDLQALVDDAGKIQEQATAYVSLSADELDPPANRARDAARRAAAARDPE